MVLHHGMVDMPSNANIADPGPQPESREFEDGRKCGTGGTDGGWVCFPLYPLGHADLLHRVERILESPQEDLRVRFYEHYHEGIEEYNRKPVRGYFKDLGVMLVSVSLACYANLEDRHPFIFSAYLDGFVQFSPVPSKRPPAVTSFS